MSRKFTVHIGTYAESGGTGLVPLTVGAEGSMTACEPYATAANASFAVVSPRRGLHYFVDEAAGMIAVHRRESGGDEAGWRELARVPSGGAAPCYLALDPEETRLAVANYASGHAALFALGVDGLPQGPPSLFRSPGSGPDAERQEGPHAHCVRFAADGRALYLADLGADRVVRLDLDGHRLGKPRLAYRAPAGSGPRHLLFHPDRPLAVLLSELASTLTLLEVGARGELRPLQVASTLPARFAGDSLGGHLELNRAGNRVFVSNRGHDSLAVFALDPTAGSGGRLELLQHVASGGAHPRHFTLCEDPDGLQGQVVVAHEKDGQVTAFSLAVDGTLARRGNGLCVPGACFVLAEGESR